MLALGLDGYPRGWVAVLIEDGHVCDLATVASLAAAMERWPAAAAIAIDMPIGLPTASAPRAADLDARAMLGPRASTVFLTPPREVLMAPSHGEAIRIARALGCPAPSAQAFALRAKIREVEAVAVRDARIMEVHPELAFRLLNGAPLTARKRSWNGLSERIRLLEQHGVVLPAGFAGGGEPAADDVVDAAACAVVAFAHLMGRTACLPANPPPGSPHHRIWHPLAAVP